LGPQSDQRSLKSSSTFIKHLGKHRLGIAHMLFREIVLHDAITAPLITPQPVPFDVQPKNLC